VSISFGYLTYPAFDIAWSDHALPALLQRIEATDPSVASPGDVGRDYAIRNRLIWWALTLAQHAGYEAGVADDADELGWLVAYIELPTGQVSWHLPQHQQVWDGHDPALKYRRIRDFCDQQLQHLPKPPEDAMRYGQATYPPSTFDAAEEFRALGEYLNQDPNQGLPKEAEASDDPCETGDCVHVAGAEGRT
jgi:hypothetical protein